MLNQLKSLKQVIKEKREEIENNIKMQEHESEKIDLDLGLMYPGI